MVFKLFFHKFSGPYGVILLFSTPMVLNLLFKVFGPLWWSSLFFQVFGPLWCNCTFFAPLKSFSLSRWGVPYPPIPPSLWCQWTHLALNVCCHHRRRRVRVFRCAVSSSSQCTPPTLGGGSGSTTYCLPVDLILAHSLPSSGGGCSGCLACPSAYGVSTGRARCYRATPPQVEELPTTTTATGKSTVQIKST